MTSLLPPNLLRLFAPRPQLPYLKPLTKDEAVRGPDKLTGVAALAKRLREEAEDAEYKAGLQDDEAPAPGPGPGPASAPNDAADTSKSKTRSKSKTETNGVAAAEADEEMGEVKEEKENGDKAEGAKGKGEQKVKKKKMDKIAEMGIVGQEARKMRLELRAKRKEEYKKNLEKNCERFGVSSL